MDLLHYIEQARKSGMGDDKIREGLLQSGWLVNDIDEAMIQAPTGATAQPKSKAMMSKTLAVIFTVLAIAVAGYFAGAYYMANYQSFPLWPFEANVPVATFTPRPSPVATPDPTADWQTYRNEEYGFEFKYPGDWSAEKLDETNPEEIISLRQMGDDGAFGAISLHRENNIINESKFLEGLKLLRRSEVTYNNISWKILITADEREESLQFINTFTYGNNFTYSLGGRYYQDRELLYSQILSTFRFIKN